MKCAVNDVHVLTFCEAVVSYWDDGAARTIVSLAGLYFAMRLLQKLRGGESAIPPSMVVGVLGLGINSMTAVFQQPILEGVVYHGLALIFITVGLQRPKGAALSRGARTIAFAIPGFGALQALVAILLIVAFNSFGKDVNAGLGMLLPLGFCQGPGQAMSIGNAWQASGLVHGPQIGLHMAAIGYAWAIFAGIPFVLWNRKRMAPGSLATTSSSHWVDERRPEHGDLTLTLALIGFVYLLTFAVVALLSSLLGSKPQLSAMIWGFHFLIGALLAMAIRPLIGNGPLAVDVSETLLSQASSLMVELITACALIAVKLSALKAQLVYVVAISTVGGIVTVIASTFVGRRIFTEDPLQHASLLFGTVTGTLPTGMALLKIVDPQLRSSAAGNMVVGATLAAVLGAPLFLFIIPLPVVSAAPPMRSALLTAVLLLGYLAALVMGWIRFVAPKKSAAEARIRRG